MGQRWGNLLTCETEHRPQRKASVILRRTSGACHRPQEEEALLALAEKGYDSARLLLKYKPVPIDKVKGPLNDIPGALDLTMPTPSHLQMDNLMSKNRGLLSLR